MKRLLMLPVPFSRDRIRATHAVWAKPDGLWYSCGTEWIDWVKSNNPEWLGKYLYELRLDTGHMLLIRSLKQFDEFASTFTKRRRRGTRSIHVDVDWPAVARKYDGIEICPFQDKRNNEKSEWYMSWDVASGAIWNKDIILDVKRVRFEDI